MAKRYEVSVWQWGRISALVPGKAGDPGRTGADNRLFGNGASSFAIALSNPSVPANADDHFLTASETTALSRNNATTSISRSCETMVSGSNPTNLR